MPCKYNKLCDYVIYVVGLVLFVLAIIIVLIVIFLCVQHIHGLCRMSSGYVGFDMAYFA